MLARPFILQAEMLARICPRIASLSENTRQKTSSRVDTRLVSVASESDRGSIPLLSYNMKAHARPEHPALPPTTAQRKQ